MPTEPMHAEVSDETYGDAMMVRVLGEVAAIEAKMKEAAAIEGTDVDVDELVYDRLLNATASDAQPEESLGSEVIIASNAVVIPPLPVYEVEHKPDARASTEQLETPTMAKATASPTEYNSHADSSTYPFERWAANGLRFPGDATEIAALAMRYQNRHHHITHAESPPLSILPAAGTCILFFVLASWSQLRRSRRRLLEQRDDLLQEIDLMETAYKDQSGPAGYLL